MVAVQEFYDSVTGTLSYLVYDKTSRDAVVIDPLLSYELGSSCIIPNSLRDLTSFIEIQKLSPGMILETHPHADHLSGASELQRTWPGIELGIGKDITRVQAYFKDVFNLGPEFATDGSQFDRLFKDGDSFSVGSLHFDVMATPGHTPACVSYLCESLVFVGDTLFMPDYGTGRCDFPGASADTLFTSVRDKIYLLAESYQVHSGHDYRPSGRPLRFAATVREQKRENIHINRSTTREGFVRFRSERDATLEMPRLFYPSLQVNIDGGRLPMPASNGQSYFKWPVYRA